MLSLENIIEMQAEERGEQHDDATHDNQRADNPVDDTNTVVIELQANDVTTTVKHHRRC